MKLSFEAAESIILRWDSNEEIKEKMIFGDRQEADEYLQAVDEIQGSLSITSISDDRNKNNSTILTAMARLEDEFRHILITHTNPLEVEALFDPASSVHSNIERATSDSQDFSLDEDFKKELEVEGGVVDGDYSTNSASHRRSYEDSCSIREIDLIPREANSNLRTIAERMIAAGYLKKCTQVYSDERKSVVELTVRKLGIDKLSFGDIQGLSWARQEAKIRRWIRSAKICIRVLFASEKKLAAEILNGMGTAIEDACFMEIVKDSAIQLFNLADEMSISKRSPEKLFKMLDLHDAMKDLMPDIETIFESKSAEPVRVWVVEVKSRLAEAVREILSEFESAVLHEPSTVAVPGGTIHPLTRYVMNYISLISDYKQTLSELIVLRPLTGSRYSGDPTTPDIELGEFEGRTPLALHLIWIIVVLQFNLEGKLQHYKDTSLANLFVMNNVHYIVQKVKGSDELREFIGDFYLKKLTGKFRQAATSYQRATWVKVLYCLRDEGIFTSGSGFSSGVSKSALRERFKSFNTTFEEVHRTQSSWLIPDAQLREELRLSIMEKLIPAYRSFLGRFRGHIEIGRHPQNYIKYSVENLETAFLDFFEGYSLSQPKWRSH